MRGSLLQGSALSMHAIVTVVQMYAPTESASDGEKDLFYDQLQDVLDDISSHDIKLIMGDFNAKLDVTDRDSLLQKDHMDQLI